MIVVAQIRFSVTNKARNINLRPRRDGGSDDLKFSILNSLFAKFIKKTF